ncbi:M48 family metalloprotease [Nocardia terpenica]|uniref:Peptidase n=1 Tax=Nocardia terpenica TaxID=455432 RepID=A0A291RRJ4_9NOCA|nr:M48 family metalloprotease [Nocardia terpenica]ATL69854.1 peptidase [Nocardia terpenica]
MVTLLLGIPWFVCSLAVVDVVADVAVSGNAVVVWVVVGVFVASGVVVFVPATEHVIARVVFRLRRPTAAEQYRLDRAWSVVSRAAGIPVDRYRLWVQETGELNAFASSGHIVAVTRGSLDRLAPQHLSAVLAHELGHHLGGHAWAGMLSYWYSMPGRLFVRVLSVVSRGIIAVVGGIALGMAGAEGTGCLIALVRWVPLLFLAGLTWMHPVLVVLWAIPLVLAWFDRYGEKYADRVAAELGFGPDLIEVFGLWLRAGRDDARRRRGLRANLFATHPPLASRIQALEKRMYGRIRSIDRG